MFSTLIPPPPAIVFRKVIFLLSSVLFSPFLSAQVLIKGKITDASTGEGMPFVSVAVKGSTQGTSTDFDGFYTLKLNNFPDSLQISSVGYKTRTKSIQKGKPIQVIDFQLEPVAAQLEEVRIVFTEDPAYPIMRKVIAAKAQNNRKALNGYDCENYTKIEFDVDNISEQLRKRKFMKKITAVVDSIDKIAGEDGKPILPVFISEAVSRFYYLGKPEKQKEVIEKTKVTGVGIQDGGTVSQLAGSTFQQYNFYSNWFDIVGKDFVSPLADSWNGYYKYYLEDSLFIGPHWCYKISIEPKRQQDLAFSGYIWIDSKSFALKQIDVSVGKKANLNFVEKIRIQQELIQTEAGPWLPTKTRVLVDIAEITNKSAGILAKFYTSNRDFKVNKPKPISFFDTPLAIEEDAPLKDEGFWQIRRHDSLSTTEQHVYKMIDSLQHIPVVRSYVEVANIVVNGYKKVAKVELGPYLLAYANNKIEGHRFRVGFKTNYDFSKKLILKGYLAYGTLDQRFKYDAQVHYILDRKPWTQMGYLFRYDLEQLGRLTEDIENAYNGALFLASMRFGLQQRAFMRNNHLYYIQRDVIRGFRQTFKLHFYDFNPIPDSFNFAYLRNNAPGESMLQASFSTTEIIGETRISKDETFIQNDNERISLGTKKLPILTFTYTLGLKNVLGSDFEYLKLGFGASQNLKLGSFGRGYYNLQAGYIPNTLPYPLLYAHRGNQSHFYSYISFNLMNFFEFVSDRYVSLRYEHNFEGLLFNRIPLIRRLKWRMVASTNLLWGGLSEKNLQLIPDSAFGKPVNPIHRLNDIPYVEVSYGIENIFRFLRIDFFHRLTYLSQPYSINRFGLRFSTQFKL
jgi:hypothetical protein